MSVSHINASMESFDYQIKTLGFRKPRLEELTQLARRINNAIDSSEYANFRGTLNEFSNKLHDHIWEYFSEPAFALPNYCITNEFRSLPLDTLSKKLDCLEQVLHHEVLSLDKRAELQFAKVTFENRIAELSAPTTFNPQLGSRVAVVSDSNQNELARRAKNTLQTNVVPATTNQQPFPVSMGSFPSQQETSPISLPVRSPMIPNTIAYEKYIPGNIFQSGYYTAYGYNANGALTIIKHVKEGDSEWAQITARRGTLK